jgi:lysine-ketoglutarate reductase/saccharopine dehydrogenase-like protein (TIGR00300 family)
MISETLTIRGHIIDSLTLSRVLDVILELGGEYYVESFEMGRTREEPSTAVLRVSAADGDKLDEILREVERHGASSDEGEAKLASVDMDGVYPEGFYSTTNLPTHVRVSGQWLEVQGIEMDCAVRIRQGESGLVAECVSFADVRAGDMLIVGHDGLRTTRWEPEKADEGFGFMTSSISTERPKRTLIRRVAESMRATRDAGRDILFVGGPAIVHSGAGPLLERLIHDGWVNRLHAGNALATHDIESQLFGTSLGVGLEHGTPFRHGHQHHLRAINTIRRAGSIRAAVDLGILNGGIMHACVLRGVPFVLAGSIRDDGPLPDVITDVIDAQRAMRELIDGIGMALLVATTLHSVATGNLLPAPVRVVCVDSDADTVIKLADRGTHQAVGLVTDCEYFLRELVTALAEG